MKIAVADLLPNPFRHLERYPIDEAKVEALVHSIKDTTFWDNLLARKAPGNAGKKEIAYGHHRLMALRKAKINEIDIPVRDLDDTAMAKIMAHENMEEWSHNAIIEQETVRAIVEAYGEGRITLPPVKRQSGDGGGLVRLAPSFKPVGKETGSSPRGEHPYTTETLAKFLGWNEMKVNHVLAGLAAVEDELVGDDTFRDLTTRQAAAVVQETRRVAKQTGQKDLARSVGNRLAAGMAKGVGKVRVHDAGGRARNVQPITIHTARRVANEMIGKHARATVPRAVPPINTFAEELVFMISDTVPTPRMREKLDAIVEFKDSLEPRARKNLVAALDKAMQRLAGYKTKLEG